ncbi:MAG TPA: hypothetical protein VGO36_08280 [Solirubrobacterales bacterium]|jgi:hypothetical protein|nr:hypothetical protein [Solirubrobacterales bacterium]
MAEAKTGAKRAKAKARGSGKSKPRAAKPKKASATAKPKKRAASKSRPASKPAASKSRPARKPAPSKPEAVREAVESTAKDASGAVGNAAGKLGHAANKVKVPLMAGGAALAGAAGGIALGARQAHRKSGLGVSSKDLAKAARKAGDVGAQVGEIALEVRRARETTNGNGRHRSPIEVVLQGLTSRGPRG